MKAKIVQWEILGTSKFMNCRNWRKVVKWEVWVLAVFGRKAVLILLPALDSSALYTGEEPTIT